MDNELNQKGYIINGAHVLWSGKCPPTEEEVKTLSAFIESIQNLTDEELNNINEAKDPQ